MKASRIWLALALVAASIVVPARATARPHRGHHAGHRAHGPRHHRAGHHHHGTWSRHHHHWTYLGYRTWPTGSGAYYAYGPPGRYATAPVDAARSPEPRYGIGVHRSWLDSGGSAGDGLGASLRLRGPGADLELEIGGVTYATLGRHERRVGGNLYLHLLDERSLHPYVVAGIGLSAVSLGGSSREIGHVYLQAGLGLAVPLNRRLTFSGDLRWLDYHPIEGGDSMAATRSTGLSNDSTPVEARLGLLVHF